MLTWTVGRWRAVGRGPLQRMIEWLEEEQANHVIHQDFDPRMLAITIVSLTGFPFLLLPTIGDEIGGTQAATKRVSRCAWPFLNRGSFGSTSEACFFPVRR